MKRTAVSNQKGETIIDNWVIAYASLYENNIKLYVSTCLHWKDALKDLFAEIYREDIEEVFPVLDTFKTISDAEEWMFNGDSWLTMVKLSNIKVLEHVNYE
jgi:hypothetical protein